MLSVLGLFRLVVGGIRFQLLAEIIGLRLNNLHPLFQLFGLLGHELFHLLGLGFGLLHLLFHDDHLLSHLLRLLETGLRLADINSQRRRPVYELLISDNGLVEVNQLHLVDAGDAM